MSSANPRDVCTPSRGSLSGLTPIEVKSLDPARQQLPQGIGTYQTHIDQYIHNRQKKTIMY